MKKKVESGHVKLELDSETKQKTLDQRLKKFIQTKRNKGGPDPQSSTVEKLMVKEF